MEEKANKNNVNAKFDISNMSEVKQFDAFDEQQDIKNILLSMRQRK